MMKLSRIQRLLQAICTIAKKYNVNGMTFREYSNAVSTVGQDQCILDSCNINPNCEEPRVIIVGAGMAGLSAAHRLTQCGIRNFVVLEAKERFVMCRNISN